MAATRRVAAERRYPTPDWSGLPARLQAQHAQLAQECLAPASSAARPDASAGSNPARAGLARQFLQLDDTQAAGGGLGYYGTRGARRVAEWLQRAHAAAIAALVRAGDARVSGAGGLPAFLQAGVVPRLVRALVAEDLRRDPAMRTAAEARMRGDGGEGGGGGGDEDEWLARLAGWVVQESAEVGRHLGEEENDEVARGDAEDAADRAAENGIVTIDEEDEGESRPVRARTPT